MRVIENEVPTAYKSFQRQPIGGSNERHQPFFGCSLDANAFSLIPKEFYLIDEHLCGSEPVQPASLSHRIQMVARDGIEPPTPAFSGPLTYSASGLKFREVAESERLRR